jgi:hypothetical protein
MRRTTREAEPNLSYSFQLPAPIRGWNARDSVAQMRPGDAITLDNWFPGTTSVTLRPGSEAFATVPGGENVETLMGLAKTNGTYQLFAATSVGIYDITAGGAVAVADIAATNGRFEYTQINVGGTAYLWTCNGVNGVRLYNSLTDVWTILNGVSVPALTGITTTSVTNVALFKYRLILCELDSLKFWYGPLNSIGGLFVAFDLGQVFKRGGYLMATTNWTVDAGDGPEDRFVAITSEGEIAVYQGTDPSSLNTFALIGVYSVGKPIGKRCFVKLGGDVGVLTEQGLWPLSQALQSAETDKRAALTDRIQSAFNDYYKVYGSIYGWCMSLLPKGPALIVNVPLTASVSYQFVMNTITGAWCRFKGWNSSTLAVLDGTLYFANSNVIKKGWTGTSDSNAAIDGIAINAFLPLGPRGRKKKVALVQPQMTVNSAVILTMALDTDYNLGAPPQQYTSIGGGASLYGTALYDSSVWGGALTQATGWKSVPCKVGDVFSFKLRLFAKDLTADWSATNFIVEGAGLL